MKKILFALGFLGFALALAPVALAAEYAPTPTPSMTVTNGTMPAPTWGGMMGQGSGGNMMYQQVSPNMMRYSNMAMPTTMAMYSTGNGSLAVWYGLMSIITIILVWIVLLMLIAVMWHWLRKHKHS